PPGVSRQAVEEGRAPTTAELRPAVEAAFSRDSYAAGDEATLVFFNSAESVLLEVDRVGSELTTTAGNGEMNGVPVSAATASAAAHPGLAFRVRIGSWRSGLYFARLQARDGRLGFAPFVVTPRRLGENRVAVVMPTFTWQAYNLRDDDGDGKGDTWYADWTR